MHAVDSRDAFFFFFFFFTIFFFSFLSVKRQDKTKICDLEIQLRLRDSDV